MERLTSTVTPQGVVGVAPVRRRDPRRAWPTGRGGRPARGPGSGQRGHDPPLGRRRGRGRGRVRRQLGGRLQPEERPRVGRLDLPRPRRAGRRDGGRDRDAPGPKGSPSSPWTCMATRTCSRRELPRSPAFVFGNEAHGLPAEILEAAERPRTGPPGGPRGEPQPRGRRHGLPVRMGAPRPCIRRRRSRPLVAAAAHDIRSPLTAMKGFGYALGKRWVDMTDGAARPDAHRHRPRRRPHGHDRPAARRRRQGDERDLPVLRGARRRGRPRAPDRRAAGPRPGAPPDRVGRRGRSQGRCSTAAG